VLVALFSTKITRWMNQDINTWEIYGPGTTPMATLLGVLFNLAIVAVAVLLWRRRQQLGDRLWTDGEARYELLIRGAMVMTLAMLVFNKVLSPQYIGWLSAPVVAAVALGLPGWDRTRRLTLAVAGATQVIFPFLYSQITYGGLGTTLVLAARNVALVVLLVWSVRPLLGKRDEEATRIERSGARVAAHATP
jgi:hypothetical protein